MTRKAENENIIVRLQTGLLGRPGRRGGASFIYPGDSSACFPFCPLRLHAPAFPGLAWQGLVLSLSGAAQGSPTQHMQLPPLSLLFPFSIEISARQPFPPAPVLQPDSTMRIGWYLDLNKCILTNRIAGNGDICDLWMLLNYITEHWPITPNYKAHITGETRFGTWNHHSFRNLSLK